ncbi:hypothetical protein HYU10_00755 [Candidatus Woesearchaeota archaeon]|nr:hypothetical protein [Candidatus Woesearchaeota archaeon]
MAVTKEEWFRKRVREGFLIFEKDDYPRLTETSYDHLVFAIINSAYAGKQERFYEIMEPHIFFDNGRNQFRIDSRNIEQLKQELLADLPLKGMRMLEIEAKEASHIEFLKSLGAEFDQNSFKKINEFDGKRITLNNYNEFFKDNGFDAVFTNGLLHNGPYIKYNSLSGNLCGLELFTIAANITKKNGFNFHADGNMITSLFMTFFQFVGLQPIEYFRHSDGQDRFMILMKKVNSKVTGFGEFTTIYTELKKRNPIRYG